MAVFKIEGYLHYVARVEASTERRAIEIADANAEVASKNPQLRVGETVSMEISKIDVSGNKDVADGPGRIRV